jgi:broad specificity phosphatase PhoE
MLKRLIIIRASETDWNLQGRWQGWAAAPLNEHGRQQANRLAHFIRNIGLTKLYTSDLRRARETAEILKEQLGYNPVIDPRLRERSIGHWQGLILPEVRSWYPEEYAQLMADPEGYQITGGESVQQVRERVRAALNDIITEADSSPNNETVGVVSHTTAIRVMLTQLVTGLDLSAVTFGNTGVSTLRREEDGSWVLLATNDGSHLEGLASRYMPEVEETE